MERDDDVFFFPSPPPPPPPQSVPQNKTISQDRTKSTKHVFSSATVESASPLSRLTRGPTQSEQRGQEPLSPTGLSSGSSSSDKAKDDPSPNQHIPSTERLVEELQHKLQTLPALGLVSSEVTDHLMLTISRLQVENDMLKTELKVAKGIEPELCLTTGNRVFPSTDDVNPPELPFFENIHAVDLIKIRRTAGHVSYYLDAPRIFKGDTRKSLPRGTIEVEDVRQYLRTHENLLFLVLDHYEPEKWTVDGIFDHVGSINGLLSADAIPLKPDRKEIHLGLSAKNALKSIISAHPNRFSGFKMVERESRLVFEEPFLFFYIHNKTVVKLQDASGLDEEATRSLKVLLAWMETNFREDWDEADALFARGKVNSKHYSKLFRPSELAVSQNHNNQTDMFTAFKFGYSPIYTEMVPCTYEFDGTLTWLPRVIPSFNENCSRTGIVTEGIYGGRSSLESGGGLVNISDLDLYPIRFAEEELERKLIARGHKFWRLRKKCLVCHGEVDGGDRYQAERRYMIDYAMYKRLHRATEATKLRFYVSADEYDETSSAFFACLPPTILGFSFAKKSWEHLSVDRITDVTWNKTAFDQLVAPDETKELIQAMVTVHGDRSNAAQDIISGKGQGLLILLHGGPGTGKTLTAESIAEVQERPLYRVTCGDIGIEPKEVEQYLGDVLEIGKAWGCVVLLDEADVFLEERSFTDQKRNAVISIFLRVLEYYDGILILTTNRVGSFDEAFKSRIQLALAYPRLNEEDRLKIWQNFIQMLPRSGQRVDMEDLKMNLNKLALVEINGRQIRNAVTMARHLAKFRHEMLRYKHMQDALRSVQRFNKYLSDVKGLSDDEWAKADKLRLGD